MSNRTKNDSQSVGKDEKESIDKESIGYIGFKDASRSCDSLWFAARLGQASPYAVETIWFGGMSS